MIDEKVRKLIHVCKSEGYGYSKFAENVEKQGWCSDKQKATLMNMVTKIRDHKRRYTEPAPKSYKNYTKDNSPKEYSHRWQDENGKEYISGREIDGGTGCSHTYTVDVQSGITTVHGVMGNMEFDEFGNSM